MQWHSLWIILPVLTLALLVLLLIILLVVPVRVELLYHRQGADDLIKLRVTLLGRIHLKLEVPEMEQRFSLLRPIFRVVWRSRLGNLSGAGEATVNPMETFLGKGFAVLKKVVNSWPRFRRALGYMLGRTVVRHFSWQTRLGTGDAAETGFLTGVCWAVLSAMLTWLINHVKAFTETPKVSVVPLFKTAAFGLDVHCIFEFRVGHIIIAGATAMGRIRQQRG